MATCGRGSRGAASLASLTGTFFGPIGGVGLQGPSTSSTSLDCTSANPMGPLCGRKVPSISGRTTIGRVAGLAASSNTSRRLSRGC